MQAYSKLIRWAGSKLQIAKVIEKYLDFERPYYEAFAGSAAIFFRNSPPHAFLNDTNVDLMDLYRNISAAPEAVWHIYSQLSDTEEEYYRCREVYNSDARGVDRSAIFLFLNHLCFNGIYRTNKSGKFNTPYGGRKQAKISHEKFLELSRKMSSASLHSTDFAEFFRNTEPKRSTIFLDPPYYVGEGRVFTEYGPEPFRSHDLARLKGCVNELAEAENTIVITYLDTEDFRELFGAHIVEQINVARNVGGFRSRRAAKPELIAVIK